MMWQAPNTIYDVSTVNHYLELVTAGALALTAWLLKRVYERTEVRLDDHDRRIGRLEIENGVLADRRQRPTTTLTRGE